jgi:hypothetical protein
VPDYTAAQVREREAIQRAGVAVKVIADGVAVKGAEGRFTGEEDGFVAVKGLFKEKTYPAGRPGQVDEMRGEADTERAVHREKRLRVAHAALGFAPTEKTRAVSAGVTYAVAHVGPKYAGPDVTAYVLVLRPL